MMKMVRKLCAVALTALLAMSALPVSTMSAESGLSNNELGTYDWSLGHNYPNVGQIQLRAQNEVDETDGQYKGAYFFYKGTAIYKTVESVNGKNVDKNGLINTDNRKLGKLYDAIADFSNGLAAAYTLDKDGQKVYEYLKTDGSVAFSLKSEYTFYGNKYGVQYANSFYNDRALVRFFNKSAALKAMDKYNQLSEFCIYLKKTDKGTLESLDGYSLYDYLSTDFSEGVAFAAPLTINGQDEKTNAVSTSTAARVAILTDGEPYFTVPTGFETLGAKYCGGYTFDSRQSKLIDITGEPVNLPKDIYPLNTGGSNNGMLAVKDTSKAGYGFYNLDKKSMAFFVANGQATNQTRYSEDLRGMLDEATGKWGFVDKTGKWKKGLEAQYEYVGMFSGGLAPALKLVDGTQKLGFIDKDGAEIIPFEYDNPTNAYTLSGFRNGYAAVYKDQKCVVLSLTHDVSVTVAGGERWVPGYGKQEWRDYLQAIYEDCAKPNSFSVTIKSNKFTDIKSGNVDGHPEYKVVIEESSKGSVKLYFTAESYAVNTGVKPLADPYIVLVESNGINSYRFKLSGYKGILPSANAELGYGQCTWLAGYAMRVKNRQAVQGSYAGLVEINAANPPRANAIIGSTNISGSTDTHMAYITAVTTEKENGKTIYRLAGVETNVGSQDGTVENWTGTIEISDNGTVTVGKLGGSGKSLKYIKY